MPQADPFHFIDLDYYRQCDEEEKLADWQEEVLKEVTCAVQDYDPNMKDRAAKQRNAAAIIAACEKLKRIVTDTLYEGKEP